MSNAAGTTNLDAVQAKVDATRQQVGRNLANLADNIDDLVGVNHTTIQLVEETQLVKQDAKKVRCSEKLKLYRLYLIVIVVILLIVAAIAIAVVVVRNNNSNPSPAPAVGAPAAPSNPSRP